MRGQSADDQARPATPGAAAAAGADLLVIGRAVTAAADPEAAAAAVTDDVARALEDAGERGGRAEHRAAPPGALA
jgi:orotidine-5'-phosphate decarboxylase